MEKEVCILQEFGVNPLVIHITATSAIVYTYKHQTGMHVSVNKYPDFPPSIISVLHFFDEDSAALKYQWDVFHKLSDCTELPRISVEREKNSSGQLCRSDSGLLGYS
ncbi:hypothetical protein SK128_025891 [Halocaridina rubra]|uniref:Uncharacterized protein n=1 Tax=Halocaridina rubra TaxID=373956 RepID=A0AAN9A0A6_HALRR